MKSKFILFLCVLFFTIQHTLCYNSDISLWYRIPKFAVDDHVIHFLKTRGINNCFYKIVSDDKLVLKCWRDETLVDVSIDIAISFKKQIMFNYLSI